MSLLKQVHDSTAWHVPQRRRFLDLSVKYSWERKIRTDRPVSHTHLDVYKRQQKIILIVNISTESLEEGYNKAVLKLDEMERLVRHGQPKKTEPGKLLSEFRPLFNEEEYCRKVEQVKHYIREGDIFLSLIHI